jgi:hypothetical protein
VLGRGDDDNGEGRKKTTTTATTHNSTPNYRCEQLLAGWKWGAIGAVAMRGGSGHDDDGRGIMKTTTTTKSPPPLRAGWMDRADDKEHGGDDANWDSGDGSHHSAPTTTRREGGV